MTRTHRWPAAVALGLSAAMLAVVGCSSRSRTAAPSPGGSQAASGLNSGAADSGSTLFRNWPRPAGAIVITGEQVGYLTPCGCTEGQKGGLIRRQIFVEKLRQQGWPLVLMDLGSLINDPNTRGGPVETKVRYTTALDALAMLRYDALAFSAHDLKLGVQEVLGQFLNLGDRPEVVAANVTTPLGLEDKLVPSLRTKAGPVEVGITAVLDPEALKGLNDPDKDELLRVRPPDEALPSVLADLEKDTHTQVLMVQGPPEVARRLAKTYPGFDVVVATCPVTDPPKEPEMLNGGKTMLIQVGQKGQYVGVVGLFQTANPKEKYRYQRVWLTSRYDTDPELAKLGEPMRKLLDEQFPANLKGAGALENYVRRKYSAFAAPSDAVYVGAETCKRCHSGSYGRWARSKHARAYEGLTKPGRNREYDADCVSCHTTGFEYESGYVSPETTAFLKGNQCENCHGPGSKHAAEPDNPDYLKAVARDAIDWKESYRCEACHDSDNDPHFHFDRYWTRIDHTGLDQYDDPRVHRGIPARVARQGP